jgi:ATP-dependent Clp protease ATP-binding subunit ClpC
MNAHADAGDAMSLPFTDRVREVMKLAEQEARRLKLKYVGTEHILLGLCKAQPGVGVTVLRNLGAEPDKVASCVESVAPSGKVSVGEQPLTQTPRAEKLIQHACEEAYDLKYNYVGTEHLILGTLRDEESCASQILRRFGVSLDTARREVLKVLGHPLSPQE